MAIQAIFNPYSVKAFNAIPSLHSASSYFAANNGAQFVQEVFRPLVIKHKLESYLGIGLLHAHFSLEPSEKCVEFNNISMPWKLPCTTTTTTNASGGPVDCVGGGKILPCAWLIDTNASNPTLVPYEFFFSPSGVQHEINALHNLTDPNSAVHASLVDFIAEFVSAADKHGLSSVVSLRLFPGDAYQGGLEITKGRANITLTPGQFRAEDLENATETTWFFAPGWVELKKKCWCQPRTGKPHLHKYGTPPNPNE